MAENGPILCSRKRRRRRHEAKPALSAHLVLDAQLKGDVGHVSVDLFEDLFPGAGFSKDGEKPVIRHVVITPWTPLSANPVEDASWTVIPVTPVPRDVPQLKQPPPSTLLFPASSSALQRFVAAIQAVAPTRLSHKTTTPLEVRILDVCPLELDQVFVSVDEEIFVLLGKSHDTLHQASTRRNAGAFKGKARDGHGCNGGHGSSSHLHQARLRALVREALLSPKVVHEGDLLSLPLSPHPITHVPPPPAKITLCEPVSQGLLSIETRIVVTKNRPHSRSSRTSQQFPVNRLLNGVLNEEDEDTSDDKFYSAAEDRAASLPPSPSRNVQKREGSSTEASDSEMSAAETGDMSDDSLEDMITLNAPLLPTQTTGSSSAFAPGSPRGPSLGPRTNGVSTPGSVFSNYTSATARPGGVTGRLFKATGLLQSIPDAALYPKPASDEDDGARAFVDTAALVKIGCFSGDWVRLDAAVEPPSNGLETWGLSAFEDVEQGPRNGRAVRIYGLPEGVSRPRRFIPVKSGAEHRANSFPHSQLTSPLVFLPPMLLANIGQPTHLRLSPVRSKSASSGPHGVISSRHQKDQISRIAEPPCAKEVTLLRLSTPLSTDRALQNTLLAGLRGYFERKQRLVKSGDLIAVAVNAGLGKTIQQASSQGDSDLNGDELLSDPKFDPEQTRPTKLEHLGVAWFKVGQVKLSGTTVAETGDDDPWGSLAVVDSSSTRMVQAGSTKGRLPGTMSNSWQYYLGVKMTPARQSGPTALSQFHGGQISPFVSPLRRRLRDLITAATSFRAIRLNLPPLVVLLSSTQRSIGKAETAARACADLGTHMFEIDAYDILTDGGAGGGDVKTEAFLKARFDRAMSCGAEDCALLLRHVDALTADRISTALKEIIAESRIVIATTTDLDQVPDGVRALFTHELEMSAPDEKEREGLLRDTVQERGAVLALDVDLGAVAIKTAALVAGDLVDVVDRATVAKKERIEAVVEKQSGPRVPEGSPTVRDVQLSGGDAGLCLTKADFDLAVDAARNNFADAIGAPKIPNVGWDDVGGLSHVKDAVMETIQLPLERPELFARGMKKRSGILFYGPPGTGKTLLAKAIATEFSLNFFSVKGPELLNMYIGESEANVRRVFQRARDARPCVVFFDELDSVAPKRGNQGDSGGVMDRIVSQLLAELDGMSDGSEDGGGVFVIGATNRPDLLDQALLRPGRFDKMLYLGISDTHAKQLTILEALTRKFTLHPSLSLRRVAETLPFTYTGADLYALCSDAMLKAITRKASTVDEKIKALPNGPVSTAYFFDHLASKEDTAVMVTQDDFLAAQRELVGSVSAKELEHYHRVRRTFEAKDEKAKEQQQAEINVAALGDKPSTSHSMNKGKTAAVKSKGKHKGTVSRPASVPAVDSDGYRHDDSDDDDYNIRTDHLKANGIAGPNGFSQRQGTGFEDPSHDDETELYG